MVLVAVVLSMGVSAAGCGSSGKKLDGGPTGGGGSSGTDAATTVQYFQLSWVIISNIDGFPLTCTEAGASTVSVLVDATVFDMACAPGQGNTGVVPAGNHSVTAKLLTASGGSLSQTPALSATLQANVPQPLPEIEFAVNL